MVVRVIGKRAGLMAGLVVVSTIAGVALIILPRFGSTSRTDDRSAAASVCKILSRLASDPVVTSFVTDRGELSQKKRISGDSKARECSLYSPGGFVNGQQTLDSRFWNLTVWNDAKYDTYWAGTLAVGGTPVVYRGCSLVVIPAPGGAVSAYCGSTGSFLMEAVGNEPVLSVGDLRSLGGRIVDIFEKFGPLDRTFKGSPPGITPSAKAPISSTAGGLVPESCEILLALKDQPEVVDQFGGLNAEVGRKYLQESTGENRCTLAPESSFLDANTIDSGSYSFILDIGRLQVIPPNVKGGTFESVEKYGQCNFSLGGGGTGVTVVSDCGGDRSFVLASVPAEGKPAVLADEDVLNLSRKIVDGLFH